MKKIPVKKFCNNSKIKYDLSSIMLFKMRTLFDSVNNSVTNFSDSEIIGRVLEGEINAFEYLVERYKNFIFHLLYEHIPKEMIDEISQGVFLNAYRCLEQCRKKDQFKYWLKSIALRKCYDFWREEYKRRVMVSPVSLTQKQRDWMESAVAKSSMKEYLEHGFRKEASEILEHLMESLTPKERMVIRLIHVEEISAREASGLLGWSYINTRVQSSRAIKKLKNLLSDLLRTKKL